MQESDDRRKRLKLLREQQQAGSVDDQPTQGAKPAGYELADGQVPCQ